MYDYINKIGAEIPVLRLGTIDKKSLKSNHYWLMAVVSKMTSLKVLKLHKHNGDTNFGQDGFKFLQKGLAYMQQNGRQLQKLSLTNLSDTGNNLHSCLKCIPDIQILQINDTTLSSIDCIAIGKILSDFKNIRELDLRRSNISSTNIKDIADGMMRAKQLEIVKLSGNMM